MWRSARARARRRIERGAALQARERDRLQHRLAVLHLVLEHHLGRDRVRRAAVEHLQRALAHVLEIGQRAGAVEQRQVAAHLARRLERVVHRRQLGAQQRLAAEAVHQPQVLVRRDVREVPRERAHDRLVLGLDVGVAEGGDESEGALAGLGERVGEVADRLHHATVPGP